jgi:hypothetical protein
MRWPDPGTRRGVTANATATAGWMTVVRPYVRPVLLAGLLAGLAFAAYSMVAFAATGRGLWYPLNLAAHALWRRVPTDGRAYPGGIAVGLVTIVVLGVVVFAPYAALAYGAALDRAQLLIGAVVYGNVVWIVGHYLVWPRVDVQAATRFSATVAWVAHMLAGLAGGLALVRLDPTRRADRC